MKPRALPLFLCFTISLGTAWGADGGPGRHARGPFNATSGVYIVVDGDTLGSIAARFGTGIAQIRQQNELTSTQVQVGQKLMVGNPAPSIPAAGTAADADATPNGVTVVVTTSTPPSAPIAPATARTLTAPATAATPATAPAPAPLPADPWPRKIQVDDRTLLIYQPQVVSWSGNQLVLRAAVAVLPLGQGAEAFGVIEAQAQTQVDRVQRLLVLEGLKITKANFPTVPALAGSLAPAVARQFGAQVRVIPLNRFEAALAATPTQPAAGVAVKNPTPRIIMSFGPAILVPIQGPAVRKVVADTKFQRVINTRAIILTAGPDGPYYLHLLDGWVSAQTLAGPWTHAPITPAGMDDIASRLAAAGQADLLNGRPSIPTMQLLAAGIPDVYVSETPAELIVFKGQPKLEPITGTRLQWAANTSADVILDTSDGSYYVLLAGRWYHAAGLQGPWAFVASAALPTDFKQIPVDSPAGVVLAAVAGTPQAREALIANGIPQTATVPRRGGPIFKPVFDGPATVSLLPGTNLEYVVNSEAPIVRVGGETYYALQAGVWFESATLEGPWAVADSIPEAIYGIPPSSPLHYVTYARVYGSTPTVVYDGYTPGYLGTVAASDGVVVYGTGYDYQPWVGNDWYAAPETFGLAAQPLFNHGIGYGYGFGLGLATAAAADAYWGGTDYRPGAVGLGCCVGTGINVYSHWGDTVAAGTRTWYDGSDATRETATGPSGASVSRDTATVQGPLGGSATVHQTTVDNPRTGENHTMTTVRVGDSLYAGPDGNVYRHTDDGWQQRSADGWQEPGVDTGWADREQQARTQSEERASSIQGADWSGVRQGGASVVTDSFGDGFGDGRLGGGDPFSGDTGRWGGGGFGGRFGGRR